MLRKPILSRSSFWLKAALAVALVALADLLFIWHEPGSTVGLFALAWLASLVLSRPGMLVERRGLAGVIAAAAFALVLLDRPGPLAWVLFGLAVSAAALSARVGSGEPAWSWSQRLAVMGVVGIAGPVLDLFRLARLKRRRAGMSAVAILGLLVMPIGGGLIFLTLFAAANPLISGFLGGLNLPALSAESLVRSLLWSVVAIMVWSVMRPRWRRRLIALPSRGNFSNRTDLSASITWSLVVFNVVFALQNGLDIAFLWSRAPLPGDMGLADYAHRGAYPLIATALLAGLFVLIALRPGTDLARRPLVRRLVVIWVAQNIVLVTSSLLRTADYIESYALTRFRIAALVWMTLVGVGLLLICWRMLRDRSAHWLIDANVRVALAVLSIISIVDLGGVAAAWNVRHAREVGGRGVELDLGYLRSLGAPALVSLVELEQTAEDPVLRDRIAAVRAEVLAGVRRNQGGWRGWRWRDQRRLDRVARLTRDRPLAVPRPGERDWDGRLAAPSPVVVGPTPISPAPEPLTSPAGG